jgi:Fuc2NAc and GlcNAc transferase
MEQTVENSYGLLGTAVALLFFALSVIGQKAYIKFALKKQVLDVPNDRSSHVVPKPRGGGIVVFGLIAVLLVVLSFFNRDFLFLFLSSVVVAFIGFKDDVSGASVRLRLTTHAFSAALIGAAGFYFSDVGAFWCFLASFFILASINIYNFMDGIDGICGGFSASVLFWMSVLFFVDGKFDYSYVGCVGVLVLLGFLILNWAPSKVFMGDVGSGFLGLFASSLFFLGTKPSIFSLVVFLILNAGFFSDASVTLVRRFLRGEKIYLSHRQHAYQHLSLRLNSHSKVALYFILYTLLYTGPLALFARFKPETVYFDLFFAYAPALVWVTRNRAGQAD